MKDSTPLRIAKPVMSLFKKLFGIDRIISRHFQTAWTSRSLDIYSCDFRLWVYLISVVFSVPFANLAKLKAEIEQCNLNRTPKTLRSFVEYSVYRFQLLAKYDRQNI